MSIFTLGSLSECEEVRPNPASGGGANACFDLILARSLRAQMIGALLAFLIRIRVIRRPEGFSGGSLLQSIRHIVPVKLQAPTDRSEDSLVATRDSSVRPRGNSRAEFRINVNSDVT